MYKLILCFFIFTSTSTMFASSSNNFSSINTFKAIVTETTNLNHRKRSTKYQLLGSLPWKLLKTVITPKLNKGEIYLYNGSSKTIYYPILNQIIKKKITAEENYTLKFIRDLKNYNGNVNFKVIKRNNRITQIVYNNGTIIKFLSFYRINNINFPEHVVIYDKDIKISDLLIQNVQINVKLNKDDFSLDKIMNKTKITK